LRLEELEPRVLLTNHFYQVPGNPQQAVPVTFHSVQAITKFRDEVGVYIVQDPSGRVSGLLPSQPGYAAAALQHAQVVFPQPPRRRKASHHHRHPPPPPVADRQLSFPGGTLLALYLVQNPEQFQRQSTAP
jgi:hypothetical protein